MTMKNLFVRIRDYVGVCFGLCCLAVLFALAAPLWVLKTAWEMTEEVDNFAVWLLDKLFPDANPSD